MLKNDVNPRLLRLLTLLVFWVLLLPVSGWFFLVFAPLAIHVIVGFQLTAKRNIRSAYIAPALLFLPLCISLWVRSHQVMSYALIKVDDNEFVGFYIFPGVIEIGWYEHDPAGLKYLEQGVTPEIADVMTFNVRRFQRFEGSSQVFDRFYIVPMYSREIPIVKGRFSLGTIYAGLHYDGWTSGSFYSRSGPSMPGSPYQASYVGFHLLVPVALATFFFARGLRRLRLHERRLRHGLCTNCGYDLTGNESGICPECGRPIPQFSDTTSPEAEN